LFILVYSLGRTFLFIAVDMHLYHISLALFIVLVMELILFTAFHRFSSLHICLYNRNSAGLRGSRTASIGKRRVELDKKLGGDAFLPLNLHITVFLSFPSGVTSSSLRCLDTIRFAGT